MKQQWCCVCGRTEADGAKFYWRLRPGRGLAGRCADCSRLHQRNLKQRLRHDALVAYGGEHPKCSCPGCGEDRLPFLCIDHVNGDGAAHRKSLRGPNTKGNPGGGAMYRWLKKNGYPAGFRVLCYNCNFARGKGPCPVHEAVSSVETTT